MVHKNTIYILTNKGIKSFYQNLGDKSVYKFNLSMNHWFYPIKKNDLDRNSKLEQNNEWGGTFDPLK